MFGVQRAVNKVNSAGRLPGGDGAVYGGAGRLAIDIRNEIKTDGEEQEGEIKKQVGKKREEFWRFNLEAQTKTIGGREVEDGRGRGNVCRISASDFSPPSRSGSMFSFIAQRGSWLLAAGRDAGGTSVMTPTQRGRSRRRTSSQRPRSLET